MIKKYCDHCGKELTLGERFASIEVNYSFSPRSGVIQPVDLCSDCQDKFKELLKDFIGVEDE